MAQIQDLSPEDLAALVNTYLVRVAPSTRKKTIPLLKRVISLHNEFEIKPIVIEDIKEITR